MAASDTSPQAPVLQSKSPDTTALRLTTRSTLPAMLGLGTEIASNHFFDPVPIATQHLPHVYKPQFLY